MGARRLYVLAIAWLGLFVCGARVATQSQIGREVAIARHLQDGEDRLALTPVMSCC